MFRRYDVQDHPNISGTTLSRPCSGGNKQCQGTNPISQGMCPNPWTIYPAPALKILLQHTSSYFAWVLFPPHQEIQTLGQSELHVSPGINLRLSPFPSSLLVPGPFWGLPSRTASELWTAPGFELICQVCKVTEASSRFLQFIYSNNILKQKIFSWIIKFTIKNHKDSNNAKVQLNNLCS